MRFGASSAGVRAISGDSVRPPFQRQSAVGKTCAKGNNPNPKGEWAPKGEAVGSLFIDEAAAAGGNYEEPIMTTNTDPSSEHVPSGVDRDAPIYLNGKDTDETGSTTWYSDYVWEYGVN